MKRREKEGKGPNDCLRNGSRDFVPDSESHGSTRFCRFARFSGNEIPHNRIMNFALRAARASASRTKVSRDPPPWSLPSFSVVRCATLDKPVEIAWLPSFTVL